MSKRTCDEYANVIKRSAGWVFGHIFHHYFGDGSLILPREGPDGSDLIFSATIPWLEDNHVSKFGLATSEMATEFSLHVANCQSPQCVEALNRLNLLAPFFGGKGLPGGEAIALVSVCERKDRFSKVVLTRKSGFGEAIDEIKPFLLWFALEKDFWKWPEE